MPAICETRRISVGSRRRTPYRASAVMIAA